MCRVTIQIDEYGVCRVYVGEHPVGLIEDIVFTSNNRHDPKLQITFIDVDTVEEADLPHQREMLQNIRNYKLLLARNPFVRFFDKGDTAPSGVPVPQAKRA